MKTSKLIMLTVSALIIVACSSRKKTSTTTASTPTTTTTAPTSTVSAGPIMVPRSNEGVNIPGNEELLAIQAQHKDVTMEQLNEGYVLYAVTSCVGCHNAKNIYKRPIEQWKGIVDDMAIKAQITEAQKDAVYKYVLAIKATQPK